MISKIREKVEAYLNHPKMQVSIEKTLSNFLLETMNNAHGNTNPVLKVILNYTQECKEP